jgi:carbonic anhydrase
MRDTFAGGNCGCGPCAAAIRDGLARRGFLRLAAAGAAGIALAPHLARAKGSTGYKAMLLSCIDPRTQAPIADWMDRPEPNSHAIGLHGKYSQFTVAGAAVAAVAPAFAAWRQTFWDNLAASVQLHGIRTLVAVNHGDCGAVGIAYGENVLKDPEKELAAHEHDSRQLREELARRHPELAFQAYLVRRDTHGAFTRWTTLVAGKVIA